MTIDANSLRLVSEMAVARDIRVSLVSDGLQLVRTEHIGNRVRENRKMISYIELDALVLPLETIETMMNRMVSEMSAPPRAEPDAHMPQHAATGEPLAARLTHPNLALATAAVPPVDATQRTTIGGMHPDDPAHRELLESGMQRDYVILTPEERHRGYVRPVRRSYVHVGLQEPYQLRDVTEEERGKYEGCEYVKYEKYLESRAPLVGRFWTQAMLDRVNKGCCATTTMSIEIAETYARKPDFYDATYCSTCGRHYPVEEF